MKTSEQILNEIQNTMALNKNNVAKCNVALSDAKDFIMHEEKELQNRLEEEYKRGMNEAWEVARELCKTGYEECSEIFGDSSVETAIKNYTPKEVREKITSYKEEQEKKKEEIIVGSIVMDIDDGQKAIVLDVDKSDNSFWVFTNEGNLECWLKNNIENTGEFIDVTSALIK